MKKKINNYIETDEEDYENLESENKEIMGYCSYCKDPIFDNKYYIKKRNKLYHPFCYQQKNR